MEPPVNHAEKLGQSSNKGAMDVPGSNEEVVARAHHTKRIKSR